MFKKRSKMLGLPPGTLVSGAEQAGEPVLITLIDYDKTQVREKRIDRIEDVFPCKDTNSVSWINVDGSHRVDLVEALGKRFDVHSLVLEDIVHTHQRPKCEDYDGYLFVVLKMLQWGENDFDGEQISLILTQNCVLSFQERPGDVFDPVRDRIRTGKGRVRQMGADYLLYSLLDAVVDGYFVVLEKLSDTIEALDEELLDNPTPQTLHAIHRLKRQMIFLRKSVWPLREVISAIQRSEPALIRKGTRVFFRDIYDHTIQVIDTIENFRDMVIGMLDTYLSSLSNKMNEVMKVLTIIATIFIPITFVAGIYGMNFEGKDSVWNMPELRWRYGYPAALGVMALIAVGMLVYFRRKKWI
ncbi:MAG: magnesium/cobalt transporter CorA [Kiritimatiellae bacterium]|nr:magnesium/cobalt transporter CorA [Kiritimatiellia bacterium]